MPCQLTEIKFKVELKMKKGFFLLNKKMTTAHNRFTKTNKFMFHTIVYNKAELKRSLT